MGPFRRYARVFRSSQQPQSLIGQPLQIELSNLFDPLRFDQILLDTAPPVPAGLTATATGFRSVRLNWSGDADAGFNVYRSTTSGFTPSAANRVGDGVTGTSYTDRSVSPSTQYYYKVTSRLPDGSWESLASNQASAQTPATPTLDLMIGGMSETEEESYGGMLMVNNDHDEWNKTIDGQPANDNEPDGVAGHRIVETDNELLDGTLYVNSAGAWSLTYPDRLKIWKLTAGGGYEEVRSGVQQTAAGAGEIALKIEGMRISSAPRDIEVTARFTPAGGEELSDRVRLTVAVADIDVDSDNDDGFNLPEGDKYEGELEQDPAQPGKYLAVNDDDSDGDGIADGADGYNRDGVSGNADDAIVGEQFVPMPLKVREAMDFSVARIKLEYQGSDPAAGSGSGASYSPASGYLRIWTKDGSSQRSKAGISAGGDYVTPGVHALSDFGLSSSRRSTVLYLEGITPSSQDDHRRIDLYIDPDGAGPWGFVLLDSTRVTVISNSTLGAPANLNATTASSSQVDLTWSSTSAGEDGFEIDRSADAGLSWTTIHTTGPGATGYSDTGLAALTTYWYRVRAKKGAAFSGYSNTDEATTLSVTSPLAPATPQNLAATAVASSQINLTWEDASSNETGFRLERSTSSAFPNDPLMTTVIEIDPNTTSYADQRLDASTTYYYRLLAYNAVGASGYTDVVSVTTDAAAPATPGMTLFYWSPNDTERIVSESVEDGEGVGLFRNGDDNPMAMARVVLTKEEGDLKEYRLSRSSTDMNVWAQPDRTGGILTGAEGLASSPLDFRNRESIEVWIEWAKEASVASTPVTLSLEARPIENAGSTAALDAEPAAESPPDYVGVDAATFRETNRLIVGFGGHTQQAKGAHDEQGDEGMLDPDSGVGRMAVTLRELGYAVATFAEDPDNDEAWNKTTGSRCGDGVHGRPGDAPDSFWWGAYNTVVHAFQNWGVRELGIYGYSHGGSSVRLLTHRLKVEQNRVQGLLVKFTGYVDAVRLPAANEKFDGNDPSDAPGSKYLQNPTEFDEEEYRYPYLTAYHVNIFQQRLGEHKEEGVSSAVDLRGEYLTGRWIGFQTQIDDGAEEPQIIHQVNINESASWIQDPYFYDGQNFKEASDDYDLQVFAPPEAVDHTDGVGGGLGDSKTDFDPPEGKGHEDMVRAIDRNPITHNYMIYHLRKAFGENV